MNGLVTVAVFGQPHELAVVRARLESEGIFCHAQDENTVAAHPFYSHLIGGIKLQVRVEDREEAMAILNEVGLGAEQQDMNGEYADGEENMREPARPLVSERTALSFGIALVGLIVLALILMS